MSTKRPRRYTYTGHSSSISGVSIIMSVSVVVYLRETGWKRCNEEERNLSYWHCSTCKTIFTRLFANLLISASTVSLGLYPHRVYTNTWSITLFQVPCFWRGSPKLNPTRRRWSWKHLLSLGYDATGSSKCSIPVLFVCRDCVSKLQMTVVLV